MGRLIWLGYALLSPIIFGCANHGNSWAGAELLPAAAKASRALEVDGTTRWFRLVEPAIVPPKPAAMIWLHGATRSMHDILSHAEGADWLELAQREGFLLVLPNGTDNLSGDPQGRRQHWNDYRTIAERSVPEVDDVTFIVALAAWLVNTEQVDPKRLYIGGASNGGMMTFRLLQDSPDIFAGAVAYIANLPLSTPARTDVATIPTPLFYLVGSADRVIPPSGGPVGSPVGGGGHVRSQEETLLWWLDHNRLPNTPTTVTTLPDADADDGCRLVLADYVHSPTGAGTNQAPVRHVLMQGGGHSPASFRHKRRTKQPNQRCRDANAAELAWDFLDKERQR